LSSFDLWICRGQRACGAIDQPRDNMAVMLDIEGLQKAKSSLRRGVTAATAGARDSIRDLLTSLAKHRHFKRDGKTVAALSHYQAKLRGTPPAGRSQIFDRCKSNDDKTRMSGISLLPASSVE
jgi:hypothetical protein